MTLPPTPTNEELKRRLIALNLRRIAEDLEEMLLRSGDAVSPRVFLEELVRQETTERERRSLERRIRRSRVGRFKPMADFDWGWPKQIDRPVIERALSGDLVRAGENLVLIAPQGLGKTMVARNVAHETLMRGGSAIFTEASRMLLDLASQESARALERRLKHYSQPDLLCIDEVGYLSHDARNADLLFEVVSRRYEQKSIIVTTNLAFSDWPTIFPNTSCVTALVDRLTHHADIVVIEGDSYRRREAETARRKRKSVSSPEAQGKARPKRATADQEAQA